MNKWMEPLDYIRKWFLFISMYHIGHDETDATIFPNLAKVKRMLDVTALLENRMKLENWPIFSCWLDFSNLPRVPHEFSIKKQCHRSKWDYFEIRIENLHIDPVVNDIELNIWPIQFGNINNNKRFSRFQITNGLEMPAKNEKKAVFQTLTA